MKTLSSDHTHHVFLVPGIFGFARLAGYSYFAHVERELHTRFEEQGIPLEVLVVPSPPTGSIRRRACVLADTIEATCAGTQGPIHIVGHSTGGLDARLLMSPSGVIGVRDEYLSWRRRVSAIVSIGTPHYGTPLAQFFSTVAGTRFLYAISLLTFATLRFGAPSLTIFSSLVASLEGLDSALGIHLRVLNRARTLLLRFIGDDARREVDEWLDGIQDDQGGIIQVMPEAMDLFNACTEDDSSVRYGYMAMTAPPPSAVRLAGKIRSPYSALSATVYSSLYALASRQVKNYEPPAPDDRLRESLRNTLGRPVNPQMNDGIVPTVSMAWGELLWAGAADHLDIIGHFKGGTGDGHTDWLHSGAGFAEPEFQKVMDAVSAFLLRS